MSFWSDAHTHSRPLLPDIRALVCVPPSRIGETDSANAPVCCGIHPWECGAPEAENAFRIVEDAARTGRLSAIGETGIDRFRRDLPVSAQLGWFRRHVLLAEETSLPLVIHCVRSESDIVGIHASVRPRSAWIVHGCSARGPALDGLVSRGIHASLGPRELSRPGASDRIRRIPVELLLLETDDSGADIREVHATAALLLETDPGLLRETVSGNWERLFADRRPIPRD